jgi:hypothetical protein
VSLPCRDGKTLQPARRNLVRSWQEQETHFFLTLAPLTGASLPHRYVFEPLIYVVALGNVLVVCAYGKSSKVFKRCSAQGSRSTKTQQVSRYTFAFNFAAWLSNRRLKRPQSGGLGRVRWSLDRSSPRLFQIHCHVIVAHWSTPKRKFRQLGIFGLNRRGVAIAMCIDCRLDLG